ncbi:hypothetical protein [Parapedobacter lycopersici]|uniref:hypothetical protein n=1 Tax=Parapedobacter lycopersici TaxID=1864939 RepID=UPI00214D3224|nr:hypothetical protein [Parapedobacter lycopersici]
MKLHSKLYLLILCMAPVLAAAQSGNAATDPVDSTTVVVDSVQFDVVDFRIDSATHTATVEITLTNLKADPRELKINVYGTQLVDDQRNAYYFSTMALGQVLMRFTDRQNYLHYVLQPRTAVPLTVTVERIAPDAKRIAVTKVVFEDRAEVGRFLDVYLGN